MRLRLRIVTQIYRPEIVYSNNQRGDLVHRLISTHKGPPSQAELAELTESGHRVTVEVIGKYTYHRVYLRGSAWMYQL